MPNSLKLGSEQPKGSIVSDSARAMIFTLIGAVVVFAAFLYFVWSIAN